MNKEAIGESTRSIGTSQTASGTDAPLPREAEGDVMRLEETHDAPHSDEALEPLFTGEAASGFRSRWDAVQIGFVDDPRQAVRAADELVTQVMKSLSETFARELATLEDQLGKTEGAATEDLRVALRRYRSFFQRLLSL